MLRLNLAIILVFLTAIVFGQKPIRNNIYLELGGNGIFLSLNYERKIIENANIYAHLGVGMYAIQPTYVTIPFGINYLLKVKGPNNFVEFGLGATYTKAIISLLGVVEKNDSEPKGIKDLNFIPSISYRWHTKKNFMYKIGITPIFNRYDSFPFFGFSVGKLF